MKNTIYIDIDSEREQPILIGKGQDSPIPQSKEEAQSMVLVDINCMTEALLSLIHLADQNEFGNKEEMVNKVIAELIKYLSPVDDTKDSTNEKDE